MTNKQWLQRRYSLTDYAWKVLRNCEQVLHKWAEDECNGRIQWDDVTGEPHIYRKDKWGSYTVRQSHPAFNREDHYLDIARKQAARFGLSIYHQGDPRGCALYVYDPADLEKTTSREINCVYNTVATAIC